ncbi:MAG: aspartate-semialdehyde dehydrogenase [Acidobacteria bacterium]|nr:aspartate-semialdehyde dehydrogenase [Acidobacteriota bacterium]
MRVGFVGWRGMVGSVLMERMLAENGFSGLESYFFSTSNVSGKGPDVGEGETVLQDAFDLKALAEMEVILTCQGGGYTTEIYGKLRESGWSGYWIDAASTLRMEEEARIVLDPVNRPIIDDALAAGIKTYAGGNCTVSLMLMALAGLFKADLVEWLTSMTYQSASGAGAANMQELAAQMAVIGDYARPVLDDPAATALDLDRRVTEALGSDSLPVSNFGVPLAASLIPWIDRPVDKGQTREEWKGIAETNRILGTKREIPIDGICVRVGAMRCHSQGFTIKLKKDVPLDEITEIIGSANDWVEVIDNKKEDTLKRLSPAAVSGTLKVPVGRIRKMLIGDDYLTAFSVGDQLLWGAAEPLHRMLRILRDYLGR